MLFSNEVTKYQLPLKWTKQVSGIFPRKKKKRSNLYLFWNSISFLWVPALCHSIQSGQVLIITCQEIEKGTAEYSHQRSGSPASTRHWWNIFWSHKLPTWATSRIQRWRWTLCQCTPAQTSLGAFLPGSYPQRPAGQGGEWPGSQESWPTARTRPACPQPLENSFSRKWRRQREWDINGDDAAHRDIEHCTGLLGTSEKRNLKLDFGGKPRGCSQWLILKIKAQRDIRRQSTREERVAKKLLKVSIFFHG